MGADRQIHAPIVLPPRKTLCTLCAGGWVGTRGGLEHYKTRPHLYSISGPLSP